MLRLSPFEETEKARRLKVLFSVPSPTPATNPYIPLLVAALGAEGVSVRFFSWKSAFVGRVDIFHVHWPELLVRRPSRLKSAAAAMLGILLLGKFRMTGTRVVWTVHNMSPHESGGRLERFFLRRFLASVSSRVYINRSSENVDLPATTILHGTYSPWYKPLRSWSGERDRDFLFFGLVRPYKGLESLLAAYSELGGSSDLTVVGKPNSLEYAAEIGDRASGLRSVTLTLAHVPDDQLTDLVSRSKVVVLPYTRMYNSGALLLALSLGAHVLAPRTPSNISLQAEFGERWITLFNDELAVSDLETALSMSRRNNSQDSPDMSQREWPLVGRQHRELYDRVVAQKQRA
ncbi:hypothetical protein [Herbiconiux sp. A18JL235]|uniref:Glycosyltransferase n=1 Tax=Herbiconiux sp. A18JL235 TaxID=3152363 RepID=A0AB39BJ04_9MICO